MQPIQISCLNTSGGFDCSIPTEIFSSEFGNAPFLTSEFSSGEMLISLFLFIGLILAIILIVAKSIKSVAVHKKYLGVNQMEGKEIYKI